MMIWTSCAWLVASGAWGQDLRIAPIEDVIAGDEVAYAPVQQWMPADVFGVAMLDPSSEQSEALWTRWATSSMGRMQVHLLLVRLQDAHELYPKWASLQAEGTVFVVDPATRGTALSEAPWKGVCTARSCIPEQVAGFYSAGDLQFFGEVDRQKGMTAQEASEAVADPSVYAQLLRWLGPDRRVWIDALPVEERRDALSVVGVMATFLHRVGDTASGWNPRSSVECGIRGAASCYAFAKELEPHAAQSAAIRSRFRERLRVACGMGSPEACDEMAAPLATPAPREPPPASEFTSSECSGIPLVEASELKLRKRIGITMPRGTDQDPGEQLRCKARVRISDRGVVTAVEVIGCPRAFRASVHESLQQWVWKPPKRVVCIDVGTTFVIPDR